VFKPAAARAGVPRASFKTLRDTCGTLQAHPAWLGHHSPSFTLDRYIGSPRDLPDPDALGLDFLARS
jgi:integrase